MLNIWLREKKRKGWTLKSSKMACGSIGHKRKRCYTSVTHFSLSGHLPTIHILSLSFFLFLFRLKYATVFALKANQSVRNNKDRYLIQNQKILFPDFSNLPTPPPFFSPFHLFLLFLSMFFWLCKISFFLFFV